MTATVWAGSLFGKQGLPPPPNSYGADPTSELGVWFLQIQPGGSISIPAAAGGNSINRRVYFTEGKTLRVANETVQVKNEITVQASKEFEIQNTDESILAEVLILQGRPLNEPVAQHGPFVMNTMQEIQQAFADYQRTQFGGWPWPEDAMTFPREKGRFSLQNGQESFPPKVASNVRGDL